MTKILNALLLFFGFCSLSHLTAQSLPEPVVDTAFIWGESDYIEVTQTLRDYNGNYIIGGNTRSDMDVEPGAGVTMLGKTDTIESPFIIKLDANMNLLWSRFWTANDRSYQRNVAIDAQNNIYLAGTFFGASFDLDPISTQFALSPATLGGFTSISGFVVKLSASGQFLWGNHFIGAGPSILSMHWLSDKLYIGATGGIIDTSRVAGVVNLSLPANPNIPRVALLQMDAQTGAKQKISIFEGSGDFRLKRMNLTPDYKFLLVGNLRNGTLDFDLSTAQQFENRPGSNYAGWLLKLDTNFNYLAHHLWEGSAQNYLHNVIVKNSTEYWVAGTYTDTLVDFQTGPAISRPTSVFGNFPGKFFLRLDSSLNVNRILYWGQDRLGWGVFSTHLRNGMAVTFTDNAATFFLGDFTKNSDYYFKPTQLNTEKFEKDYSYAASIDSRDSILWTYKNLNITRSKFEASETGTFDTPSKLGWFGTYASSSSLNLGNTGNSDYRFTFPSLSRGLYYVRLKTCSQPNSLPYVNRSYYRCDTARFQDTLFSQNGWHRHQHILRNKAGCDSVIVMNSFFVLAAPPAVRQQGTFLEIDTVPQMFWQWIDCATGQVLQNGGALFYPTQIGNYALVYGTPDSGQSCQDTTPCFSITQIGTPEYHNPTWTVYPNPTRHTLELTGPLDDLQALRLLSLNGAEIERFSPRNQIDLSAYPAGLYLLEITSKKQVTSRIKVIRQE